MRMVVAVRLQNRFNRFARGAAACCENGPVFLIGNHAVGQTGDEQDLCAIQRGIRGAGSTGF